jgi:hypothetical protein
LNEEYFVRDLNQLKQWFHGFSSAAHLEELWISLIQLIYHVLPLQVMELISSDIIEIKPKNSIIDEIKCIECGAVLISAYWELSILIKLYL